MKKIYYLKTCSTCQRILKNMDFSGFELQNIKEESITEDQINQMKNLAGSFEALFSRKAVKFRLMDLQNKELTELDCKSLILKEYTFLKRPVVIVDDYISVGSSKKQLEELEEVLQRSVI